MQIESHPGTKDQRKLGFAQKPGFRLVVTVVLGLLLRLQVFGDETVETEAKVTAGRFLTVLIKNPRPGMAFDKVYSFHIDRGSIAAFHESLRLAGRLPESIGSESDPVAPDQISLSVPADTDPATACLLFGLIDLKHSEIESAIVAFQHAISLKPKDPLAHWFLARAFSAAQQFDNATVSLEHAIGCPPSRRDLPEIYKELAHNLQRAQKADEALNAWKRLEAEFPGDLRVKEQIATTLAEDGRWDEALKRFQALAKETKNSDQRVAANLSASDVMIQLGRNQDAISLLESQLGDLDPDGWQFKDIRRRIESIFRGNDDLAGLVTYYEAWIKAHSDDVDAMARLGRTLSLQNKTAEASEWYRKAIELAPSNVSLRESLIEQLVREDQPVEAIKQYEEMARFDGGNQDHIEKWGQLCLNQKDMPLADRQAKAAAVWERLLTNRPDDPVTMARLAGLLRRADLRDRAIALYRSAIENAPNEPQYREYLGEYLYQLQRIEEAVVEWKQIADGDRRTKANLIRLAEVLNRFGQNDPGISAMREACGLNPDPLERVQFAEMLRTWRAAGRQPPVSTHATDTENAIANTESHTQGSRPPLADDGDFTEALEQLNLADQSAEAPDERQQILKERVQCLIAAGQLEQQIERLSAELDAGTNVTDPNLLAERWRTLALYQDAAEKINDATASAIKVVELQPDSIPGWSILASLYERTGRLGDAADAMKKLASLDRRGISEYLRKSARLQVRLGQFDSALATGRDVIKATPGNPEAYQFFADLAFEVGQPKIAVESLRQAVRVNPGDEAALRALAKTLADEFQTPEAIELYWRAFEKAPDLESQTQIVVALSNLYLRSNQFPKLIERLELRSRELNLPTEMTRCIAMAYRESGDFEKARVSLERLESDTSADVGLLRELKDLALKNQNLEDAIDYQTRIVQQSGAEADRQQLAALLKSAGRDERIEAAGDDSIAILSTPQQLLATISSLRTVAQEKDVVSAAEVYLERFPNDWSVLTVLAGLYQDTNEGEKARQLASKVMLLEIAAESQGSLVPMPVRYPLSNESLKRSRLIQNLYGVTSDSFLDAYCRCCDILFLQNDGASQEQWARLFSVDSSKRLGLIPIAFVADHLTEQSLLASSFFEQAQMLKAVSSPADRLILNAIELDTRIRLNCVNAELESTFQKESIDTIVALASTEPVVFEECGLTSRLVAIFDGDADAKKLLASRLMSLLSSDANMQTTAVVASVAWAMDDLALLAAAATVADKLPMETDGVRFLTQLYGSSLVLPHHRAHRAKQLQDPNYLVMQANLACRFSLLPRDASTVLVAGSVPHTLAKWRWRLFSYSKEESELAVYLLSRQRQFDESFKGWIEQSLNNPDALFRARAHLLLAECEDGARAIGHLIQAAELMPDVPGLRFDVATEAARVGLYDEATQLVDSIDLNEPTARIELESKALEWSLAAGNKDRARLAAKRLFGLPIDQSQQLQLASRLSQLGLEEELASLNARLGRGAETRQSVLARKLQTYMAQGNEQLAGEVAWELLKLASGGTLFSGTRPNDDRDDGGERLQAIKALGKLKRLQPLIDRYEAMLEASPESLDLLEILCEFHEAAEQFPQLAEKRDRIALLSKKAPPSLKAKAVALENSGDVSGACDIYLQILKDDPEAFAEEMETYVQAFERAKRHADFLTAVFGLDPELWSGNAALLVNITADLARAKTNEPVVKKSVEAMLANEDTRRLAIGGFLARPDVIAEEQLLPAIQREITSPNAFDGYARTNEVFLILQGIRQESSLKSLRDFLSSRRAAGRQPSLSTRNSDDPDSDEPNSDERVDAGTRDTPSGLLQIFLEVRLGLRNEVEQQLSTRLVGEAKTDRSDLRFMLFAMNIRLKDLGSEWTTSRRLILEWLLKQTPTQSNDFPSLEDSLVVSDDAVMEELGAVYELLGDSAKSRAIMNRRVQLLISNTGLDGSNAADSIRQLLQAGEKIQASGFPIEGTRLLLNVTQHDIDEFTKDLDNDKAIAFKSRFNATLRWAKQQITAEKIVSWFEIAAEEMTDKSQRDLKAADLLLEVNGTTDPRTQDRELLSRLRLQSGLLASIEKQDLANADLGRKIDAMTTQLLTKDRPDLRLLTVAMAFAIQRQNVEQIQSLVDAVEQRLLPSKTPGEAPEATPLDPVQYERIPQALRHAPDLSGVLLASQLSTLAEKKDIIRRLLVKTQTAANHSANRLVRIAVLNECLVVAKRIQLEELSQALAADVDSAINEQGGSGLFDGTGTFDLAHEIRRRLLKQPVENSLK